MDSFMPLCVTAAFQYTTSGEFLGMNRFSSCLLESMFATTTAWVSEKTDNNQTA